MHNIKDTSQILLQQNPDVIDQGVFHNDVIAVGNANVLLCHQQAFLNQTQALDDIREAYVGNKQLYIIEVPTSKVSIQDAVSSYLFNSQLVSMNDDAMLLVAPQECQRNPAVKAYIEELIVADNPINQVQFLICAKVCKMVVGPLVYVYAWRLIVMN